MRFGNASTTVTGTVTPASVNTRVMPHLRPTRPMVIVKPSHRESYDWLPLSLQQVSGLGTRDPRLLESRRLLDDWRRRPRAPTSKLDGGVYLVMRFAQAFTGYPHACRRRLTATRVRFARPPCAPATRRLSSA